MASVPIKYNLHNQQKQFKSSLQSESKRFFKSYLRYFELSYIPPSISWGSITTLRQFHNNSNNYSAERWSYLIMVPSISIKYSHYYLTLTTSIVKEPLSFIQSSIDERHIKNLIIIWFLITVHERSCISTDSKR